MGLQVTLLFLMVLLQPGAPARIRINGNQVQRVHLQVLVI